MKYRLKIIDKSDTDFGTIRESGFGGVIFTEHFFSAEKLREAKRRKLMTLIHIRDLSRESCYYLDRNGVNKGEMYDVTLKSVKRTVQKLGYTIDLIDGIVIPAPRLKGLLWNEAFTSLYEDFCGRDIKEDFPIIFDKYTENADLRLWYYRTSAKALFLEHILSISEYFAALGKKVCFDFGRAYKGIELIKKQLNPFWFQKKKIPVIYETDEGITLVCGREMKKPNLLVLPMRAIMLNYAYGAKYLRYESALTLAISEEEYYKKLLKKCNIEYKIADEFTFADMNMGLGEIVENLTGILGENQPVFNSHLMSLS